jgi:hypothetical protein
LILIAAALNFPWGFLPLVPAVIGTLAWAFDVLWLRKLCVDRESLISEETAAIVEPLLKAEAPSEDHVKAIVELGFTSNQAIDALAASGDDLEKAIDSLLK